jgi:predicted dehydrogenase
METLRYGIVGGGFVAAFHLRALREVRGIDVAGFVSKDPVDHLLRYASENGLGRPRSFASIKDMLPHVDVVAIFAPNFVRPEIVEEIADGIKGGAELKGIIAEKPLARNMAEGRRMIDLVAGTGVPTAYFENQIHMNCITSAKTQLKPVFEAMGPPLLVRSGEEHAGPHSGWFWDPTRQGGGVMSDMGCHCLGVGWFALTPPGKPVDFLKPESVMADLSLLKWGLPRWRQELLSRFGVDYGKTPAEDFATGMVNYRNPETGALVKAQFTVSWMYDKQGLRLSLDAIGPGYAFEMNSLRSPLEVFIGDAAASSLADTELALEKQQASTGLLTVQPNEPDLYGYTDENVEAAAAFRAGRSALLDWNYGLEIVRLNSAAYLSAERNATVDLTDQATLDTLETYVPLIQLGRGGEVLAVPTG